MGLQLQRKTQALKTSLIPIKKEVDATKKALGAAEGLTAGTPAVALEELMPKVMLELFNQRAAHGVSLSMVTALKGGTGQVLEVRNLAEPIGDTSVKSVSIKVTGTYKYYTELMDYLKQIQKMPVAVSRLRVQDNTFEMTLRVFGTLSAK
jgi:hypothetical protein